MQMPKPERTKMRFVPVKVQKTNRFCWRWTWMNLLRFAVKATLYLRRKTVEFTLRQLRTERFDLPISVL